MTRIAAPQHFLMCRPTHFDVTYSINAWMRPDVPTDTGLAIAQWDRLVAVYRELGHRVALIEPVPGLPDMVFAANGGLVVDGRAMGARFKNSQRHDEGDAYLKWFAAHTSNAVAPTVVNEGEGDLLLAGETILAGTGFRSAPEAAAEVQEYFGRPVIQLQLVDPRFYHLDTAMTVLDAETVAYLPAAFSPGSQDVLRRLFPDAIIADEADAAVLGLNAVSDGHHVVLGTGADRLAAQFAERGFEPIGVDMSELRKSGGSVKCCTLELRGVAPTAEEAA